MKIIGNGTMIPDSVSQVPSHVFCNPLWYCKSNLSDPTTGLPPSDQYEIHRLFPVISLCSQLLPVFFLPQNNIYSIITLNHKCNGACHNHLIPKLRCSQLKIFDNSFLKLHWDLFCCEMLHIPFSETAGITKDILGLVVLLCAVAGNSKWSYKWDIKIIIYRVNTLRDIYFLNFNRS